MKEQIFTKLQKKKVRVDPQTLSEIARTQIRSATLVRIANQVFATKSQSEKEEEEIERLQKPSPKKKPPRKDRSRKRMKVEDKDIDKDPDLNTKDMSMNYKIVGSELERVWFRGAKEDLVTVRNQEGKVVQVSQETLDEDGSKYEVVKDEDTKSDKGDESGDEKKEPTKEDVKKKLKQEPLLTEDDLKELEQMLDLIEEETKEQDQKYFDEEYDRIISERKKEAIKKEEKALEEKEVNTKDKAQKTLSSLAQSEDALKALEQQLQESSEENLKYFNEALQEQKKEIQDLVDKIENSEDEAETEKLKNELAEKQALSDNLSQVQDIISVNAILRDVDTELDDKITDEQKSLVKFLGEHSDTSSFEIQKVMSNLVAHPEGANDDQKQINSKFQTQQAIKTLMADKSLDDKMDILMGKDLGEGSHLRDSFLQYKKQLDNPKLSPKKRKELEALADDMFNSAIAEALTLESGSKDSTKKDKKDSPKSKKEQREIRKNFLDGVGDILENLAEIVVNPDTEVSDLVDSTQDSIKEIPTILSLKRRIENESDTERKRVLQEQLKQLQEQSTRMAKIKRNLVIAWGKI